MQLSGKGARKKYRDSQGPGVPRARAMEVRALLLVGIMILAGFGMWWGFQQMEKHAYLDAAKPDRISTAAGGSERQ